MKLNIAFILPINGISGGIFVVYIQAKNLIRAGHKVTLIFKEFDLKTSFSNFDSENLPFFTLSNLPSAIHFDVVISTWWETFYLATRIPASKYMYFVQSDERRFYPVDDISSRRWVEMTYRFREIGIITEAKWIQKVLFDEFGHKAKYAPNGINTKVFNPNVVPFRAKGSKFRVLIEGPGSVDYKRIDDAFAITNAFRQIEVWYVCSDGIIQPHWRTDECFVKVPFKDMPTIYAACDVLIKVSSVEGFFGPPLEMMATGKTSIVSNVTGFDEYIVDEHNALVIDIGDVDAGRKALQRIITDGHLKARLDKNSFETALNLDWEKKCYQFEKGIFELYSELPYTPAAVLKQISDLGDVYEHYNLLKNHSLALEHRVSELNRHSAILLTEKIRELFPNLYRGLKLALNCYRKIRNLF